MLYLGCKCERALSDISLGVLASVTFTLNPCFLPQHKWLRRIVTKMKVTKPKSHIGLTEIRDIVTSFDLSLLSFTFFRAKKHKFQTHVMSV